MGEYEKREAEIARLERETKELERKLPELERKSKEYMFPPRRGLGGYSTQSFSGRSGTFPVREGSDLRFRSSSGGRDYRKEFLAEIAYSDGSDESVKEIFARYARVLESGKWMKKEQAYKQLATWYTNFRDTGEI